MLLSLLPWLILVKRSSQSYLKRIHFGIGINSIRIVCYGQCLYCGLMNFLPKGWFPADLSPASPSWCSFCLLLSGHMQICKHCNPQRHEAASPPQCLCTLASGMHSCCLQAAQGQNEKDRWICCDSNEDNSFLSHLCSDWNSPWCVTSRSSQSWSSCFLLVVLGLESLRK